MEAVRGGKEIFIMYCEYNSGNLITVFKKLCSPWSFMKEMSNNLFTLLGFYF